MSSSTAAKMASPEDHLQALEKELDELQKALNTHKHTVINLTLACHDMRTEFDDTNKKHARLTRAFEDCRTDLWYASSSAGQDAAARAEERMSSVIEEQVRIQRRMPQMYRRLGEMIGARDSTMESIHEYKNKVARKVEEIHTLRPCQSLVCAHCGRGGGAVLQRARVNFKDRVARVWRKG